MDMSTKIAFSGFRHSHILSLYKLACERPDIEITGASETHAETRDAVNRGGGAAIAFDSLDRLLNEVECDVIAIGDYYSRRGPTAIAALTNGKHVISDKPLSTSLDEVDQIEELARKNGLKVGCMLGQRDTPPFRGARNIIQEGSIGEVHGITFLGHHPLLLGSRPRWYFEKGKHGGTINDIAVHAINLIPWLTGLHYDRLQAARCWNAFASQCPNFKDAGQMMLSLSNGCGVMGDVSYFAPDSQGYTNPYYWRMTIYGRKGVLETGTNHQSVTLTLDGESAPRAVGLPEGDAGGYLNAFLADVAGSPLPNALTTDEVIASSRVALSIQRAADKREFDVSLNQKGR